MAPCRQYPIAYGRSPNGVDGWPATDRLLGLIPISGTFCECDDLAVCARQKAPLLDVLKVTFPFFALVLCGYLSVRRALLPQAAIPGLNSFVLFFALPCLLFRFGAGTPIAELLDPTVFGVYLVCALVVVALTLGLTMGGRIGWNDASFGALTAAFPNSGFMGVPLLVTLLGERAAAPVIVTIAIDLVITTSLCIALSRLGKDAAGARAAALRALRGVLGNPMPWAILFGGLFSAMQFELHGAVDKTIALLANAASPVALFTIGAVLARSQMTTNAATPWQDYVPVALIKLFVHPLLVLSTCAAARFAGLTLETPTVVALVLVAALPSASNVSLLAERFGANNGRIARIILVSTAASFFSFSACVALLT